jgi:hypothetical protein
MKLISWLVHYFIAVNKFFLVPEPLLWGLLIFSGRLYHCIFIWSLQCPWIMFRFAISTLISQNSVSKQNSCYIIFISFNLWFMCKFIIGDCYFSVWRDLYLLALWLTSLLWILWTVIPWIDLFSFLGIIVTSKDPDKHTYVCIFCIYL